MLRMNWFLFNPVSCFNNNPTFILLANMLGIISHPPLRLLLFCIYFVRPKQLRLKSVVYKMWLFYKQRNHFEIKSSKHSLRHSFLTPHLITLGKYVFPFLSNHRVHSLEKPVYCTFGFWLTRKLTLLCSLFDKK